MHSPAVARRKCNQRLFFFVSFLLVGHVRLYIPAHHPEACKDRIMTKTQTGRMKTSLPEAHARYTHAHPACVYWKRDRALREKKTVRKTSWQNRLRKKHPILSGVEICHKHIPHPIRVWSYFNDGKCCMRLRRWDAAPKHRTSVVGHSTEVVLRGWRGKYIHMFYRAKGNIGLIFNNVSAAAPLVVPGEPKNISCFDFENKRCVTAFASVRLRFMVTNVSYKAKCFAGHYGAIYIFY